VGFHGQQGTTVRTRGTRVEKRVNLLLKQVVLQGAEELFGLGEGQPQMLDTLVVLVEGDHIGGSLFLTLIAAHDELQFDTHTGASPGSSGRGMIQVILPELIHNPQHLPALLDH
jgi:hypothetical protein